MRAAWRRSVPGFHRARAPVARRLGGNGLGEALAGVAQVQREPLEYLELEPVHELARAAVPDAARGGFWARRKLYRLGRPILVQEVFLPALYPS